MVAQSVHQALIEVVIAQAEFGHRPDNGDFTCVGKRRPGRGDAEVAKLNHAATFPVDFQKTIAAMAVLFHQGDQVFLELFKRKGVPIGNGGVCFNEFEGADGTALDSWWAVGFQEHRVNVLHQQRLEVVRERRVVAVRCHRSTCHWRRPLTLRTKAGEVVSFKHRWVESCSPSTKRSR